MASDDVNIDAGQSIKSKSIENSEFAKTIVRTDGSDGSSNTTIDSKKRCAALISELDTLVNTVQEGSKGGSTSASESNNAATNLPDQEPSQVQSQDSENSKPKGATPVALALLQASENSQNSGNKLIESLATMTSELTELTTKVTEDGANWSKNFYNYGLPADATTAGSAIGQWSVGTEIPAGMTDVNLKISGGTYYMSVDGGPMLPLQGGVQTDPTGFVLMPTQAQINAVFPSFSLPDSSSITAYNNYQTYWNSGYSSAGNGTVLTVKLDGSARTTGGSGIANASTSDMQNMLSQDSVILNIVNQRDTAAQSTTNSTTTLESAVVGAIDSDYTNANSTLQMVNSVLNLINQFNN